MVHSKALIHLFCFLGLFASTTLAESNCNLVDSAIQAASRIRGLKLKKKVSCLVQNKEEVKKFILKAIDEQLTPEDIAAESTRFKAFGMIPEDWDYKKEIVELYMSQIGGYYDPKAKRYIMAAWLPDLLQETVAVHELTHALQDQYYNIEKFHASKDATTDQQLARAALIEGDATAVMMDHPRELMGQPPLATLPDVENLVLQQTLSLALSPTIREAPASISYSIMFPYASGLRFAHALLRKGGYFAIDKAYDRLPETTEEILHPEKYIENTKDYVVIKDQEVLKAANLNSATVESSEVFGEFTLSMLLGNGNSKPEAAKAAAGWAGDRVLIVKDGKKKRVLLLSQWDSEEDKADFYQKAQAVKKHLDSTRKSSKYSTPTISKLPNKRVLISVEVKD